MQTCIWFNAIISYQIIIPTNITIVEKDKNWMNALLIQMENLVLLDEKTIIAKNFHYYIQKF
jgi:hypothetical protein